MLYKQILIALCLFSACRGMEKTNVDKKNSIHLITKDEERIVLPEFCIPLCEYFKDMIADFGSDQNHEIRFEWTGKDLQVVLHLLSIKHGHREGDFQRCLQEVSLIDLARILTLVNFINSPSIFGDILIAFSEKIDQIRHRALPELWDQLEEVLPRELQKMIQDLVLIKHNAITPLIKVTHRIKERIPRAFDYYPDWRFLKCSAQGRFMAVTYSGGGEEIVGLYDLTGKSIKKVQEFDTDYFGFSPDEKYLFYRDKWHIHLVALQGGENRSFQMNNYFVRKSFIRCRFSKDSKTLIITDTSSFFEPKTSSIEPSIVPSVVFSVETGEQLEEREEVIKEDNPITLIKSQFPKLCFDWNTFSDCYEFSVVKTMDHSCFYVFDMRLPEAIKLCFSGKSDRSMYKVISRGNSVFLNMGFPSYYNSGDYDKLIQIDVHGQESYPISYVPQELSAFAHDKILMLSKEKRMIMYFFITSTSQWMSIDLSENFDPREYEEARKESLWFADFDTNYFVVRAKRSGQYFFEMHFIPRDLLLQRCTLKEMMMLINYAKNPSLQIDSSYKRMYDNLDADVRKFLAMKTIEEEETNS